MMRDRDLLRYLLLIAALAALQLSGSNYLANLANFVAIQALPAIGLSLLMGYTGQISLGHAAFYGLGAYGSVLLATHLGIDPWLALVVAAGIVGVIGWSLGWLVFRLQGHYLAMATLGFGIIVHVCLVEFRQWTGGPNGLTAIAPLSILGREFYTDKQIFPIVWSACIVAVFLAENLVRSPIGLTMRGISENGKVVASLGMSPDRMKRLMLMISAVYAAVAGGLYARYVGYLSPGPFDVGFSIKLLLMVAIGGFARIWGVLFGVAFVTLISEVLKPLGNYDIVVFGLLLIVAVVYCRDGLLQTLFAAGRRVAQFGRGAAT
jgi:branched-chain amino acid transport system permease protein